MMTIKSITLHRHRRVLKGKANKITLRLHAPLQLILGTNGCGKSTLLNLIALRPARAGAFHQGGYCLIDLEFNAIAYSLKFTADSAKGSYSFLRAGTELNVDGLYTTQMQLTAQEFALDKIYFKLAAPSFSINDYSAAELRELYAKVCDVDVEWLIDIWTDVGSRMKTHAGTLKHYQRLLSAATLELISEEELSALKRSLDDHERRIQELKDSAQHWMATKDYSRIMAAARQDIDEAAQRVDQLVGLLRENPLFGSHPSEQRILDALQSQQNELQECTDRIKALDMVQIMQNKRFKEGQDHSHSARARTLDEIEKKKQQISDLGKTLSLLGDLLAEQPYFFERVSTHSCLIQLKSSAELLDDQLSVSSRYYELGESWRQYSLDERIMISAELKAAQGEHKLLQGYIEHMLDHEESGFKFKVRCPKCTHFFIPEVDRQSLDKALAKLSRLEQSIRDLERQSNIGERISALEADGELLNKQLASYPLLKWAFEGDDFCKMDPARVKEVLRDLYSDLKAVISIQEIKADIKDLHLKASNMDTDSGALDALKEQIDKTEAELEALIERRNTLRASIDEHKEVLGLLDEASCLAALIGRSLDEMWESTEGMIEEGFKALVDQQISYHEDQREKSLLKLASANQAKGRVTQIKTDMDGVNSDLRALQAIEKSISPREGLISYTLGALGEVILQEVNEVLAKIWVKEISVINSSGDSLSYRYAAVIEGEEVALSDCSKGEREIISLAFKLALIKYSPLKDYPLFLDEFGSNLDQYHTRQVFQKLQEMVEEKPGMQLFIVSHFSEVFTSLSRAQVSVLDASNILSPMQSDDEYLIIE